MLNTKMRSNDFNREMTIREYLKRLLLELWMQEEGFSGKRPFGNSGWKYEVYEALVKHKYIDGKLDEDGHLETVNEKEGDRLILKCIHGIFK